MPYIIQIGELIGAAVLGGWISRALTIRSRVRQENAGADKAETEVKAEQINNIEAIVAKVYQPTIDHLTKQVKRLTDEVEQLRGDNEAKQLEIDQLKDENIAFRDIIRKLQPEALPSRRSENAKKQPRSENGQFVKKDE